MKKKCPKIPAGWYRLRKGSKTTFEDRWWSPDVPRRWHVNEDDLTPVGDIADEVVIRKRLKK
jgi:hypothetical protein